MRQNAAIISKKSVDSIAKAIFLGIFEKFLLVSGNRGITREPAAGSRTIKESQGNVD